jgi:hypothetical protein
MLRDFLVEQKLKETGNPSKIWEGFGTGNQTIKLLKGAISVGFWGYIEFEFNNDLSQVVIELYIYTSEQGLNGAFESNGIETYDVAKWQTERLKSIDYNIHQLSWVAKGLFERKYSVNKLLRKALPMDKEKE